MKPETFEAIKKAGNKLGFKVKKSDTLFDYIKKFGTGFEDLLRYACLYLYTDVRDSSIRKELVQDMKQTLKGVNKEELTAFFMQLDRASFGLTGHLRHIFMSLFGIEITTYNKFVTDKEWLEKEFKDIEDVLKKSKFENEIQDLRELLDKIKKRYD